MLLIFPNQTAVSMLSKKQATNATQTGRSTSTHKKRRIQKPKKEQTRTEAGTPGTPDTQGTQETQD